MKSLSTEDIAKRMEDYRMSQTYAIQGDNPKYNRMLKIYFPGKPISDSRPRDNLDLGIKYNPHKTILMKILKAMMDVDPPLRRAYIKYNTKVLIKAYMHLPKTTQKLLSPAELAIYNSGDVGLDSVYKQDVDNYEKVHYDVLQDDANMIILDDRCITGNGTDKFYSIRERVEVSILYNKDYTPYYIKKSVDDSIDVVKYELSWKYRAVNNLSYDQAYCIYFIDKVNYYLSAPFYKTKRKSIFKNIIKIINKLYKPELVLLYNVWCNKRTPENKINRKILEKNLKTKVTEVHNKFNNKLK